MEQRLQDPAGVAPPDWRGLCEELFEALDGWHKAVFETGTSWVRPDETYLLDRARAALSQPEPEGRPAPAPAGEVGELVAWLREQADHELGCTFDTDYTIEDAAARNLTRAADLLERQAAPVPVSERLPGEEDCDAEGRCWLHLPDMGTEPLWRLTDPALRSRYHTHWLPAHALPLPSGEVE